MLPLLSCGPQPNVLRAAVASALDVASCLISRMGERGTGTGGQGKAGFSAGPWEQKHCGSGMGRPTVFCLQTQVADQRIEPTSLVPQPSTIATQPILPSCTDASSNPPSGYTRKPVDHFSIVDNHRKQCPACCSPCSGVAWLLTLRSGMMHTGSPGRL